MYFLFFSQELKGEMGRKFQTPLVSQLDEIHQIQQEMRELMRWDEMYHQEKKRIMEELNTLFQSISTTGRLYSNQVNARSRRVFHPINSNRARNPNGKSKEHKSANINSPKDRKSSRNGTHRVSQKHKVLTNNHSIMQVAMLHLPNLH